MKTSFERLLDLMLPPLCLNCDAHVGGKQTLCPTCWKSVHFIAAPQCDCCGAPFEFQVGEGTLCGECISATPEYTRARSVMLYDDASKRMVLGFKHSDRLHAVSAMAIWMKRAGEEFWETADVIVPVPLHRWRLFARRYNQAALLSMEIGKLAKKTVGVDVLQRKRSTQSQGHLNRQQRKANIAGAIEINPRENNDIAGKTIVLVDDVLTTGATVNECSRILRKAGAANIYVLTLSRTKGFGC